MKPKLTHRFRATTEKIAPNRFVGVVYADIIKEYGNGLTSSGSVMLSRLFPFASDDTARKYAKEEAAAWSRGDLSFNLNHYAN